MAAKITRWQYLLYPELRRFELQDQAGALRAAAATKFDAVEYVGLVVALLVTLLATRYSGAGMGLADRFGAALANFLIAIPMLLVLGGPFYVRRTRRGLRAQLAIRDKSKTD